MKIAVTGYYGFSNFGDDLFIIASALGADKYWKEHELIFVSPPIKGINANFIVPRWFPKNIYANMGLLGQITRMYFLLFALLKSDAVLNAGGSIVSSHASHSKIKIQILMKKFFKKKIIGIGLSIGPFSSDKDKTSAIDLIQYFDILSVRDNKSCQIASEFLTDKIVTCSTDLVGIVARHYNFDKISKLSNILGASLMQFDDKSIDVYGNSINVNKWMIETIKFAKEHQMIVRVFILNTHPVNGDIEISERFINMLQQSNVEYEKISLDIGAMQVWEKIAECSVMLSFRLHGAICAYMSDVQFYLFEYHQKCTDFLDDIGYTKLADDEQEIDKLLVLYSKYQTNGMNYKKYSEVMCNNFEYLRKFM